MKMNFHEAVIVILLAVLAIWFIPVESPAGVAYLGDKLLSVMGFE